MGGWGCNNVCRITWGRGGGGGWWCYMDFSKWEPEIVHEIEYLVFHNYFVFCFLFFSKFTFSCPISFLYYCIVRLLPSSATVKMDYEKNMENARYATNDDTRLNHLVLLYKFNCIRIMFLNTYNKNVDIIWNYCIMKYRDCLGRDILGTTFFLGPNLVSFNRAVVPYEISKVNLV